MKDKFKEKYEEFKRMYEHGDELNDHNWQAFEANCDKKWIKDFMNLLELVKKTEKEKLHCRDKKLKMKASLEKSEK